ncbi:MAG: DUF1080 domain-containing protein [Bryobacteraceae bacterium]
MKLFSLCLSAVVLAAPCAGANKLSRHERRDGFQLLFDGKSLRHWHTIRQRPDAGSWTARKGILTWKKGGAWLATHDMYYDFILRLEYRTHGDSNSGVFLRSTPEGNPAFTGMELQILSDAGKPAGAHSTGSLYGAVPPTRNMAKPDGEWNKVEVTVRGRRVAAVWNGERVIDADLDDANYQKAQTTPLADRADYGHVGLQGYNTGRPVEFRNIRIRVLKWGPGFPTKPLPDDPEFRSPALDRKPPAKKQP